MTNDKRKVTIIVDDSDLRKYKKILVDEIALHPARAGMILMAVFRAFNNFKQARCQAVFYSHS